MLLIAFAIVGFAYSAEVCKTDAANLIETYQFSTGLLDAQSWAFGKYGINLKQCLGKNYRPDPRELPATTAPYKGMKLILQQITGDTVDVVTAATYPFAKYNIKYLNLQITTPENQLLFYNSKFFQFTPIFHKIAGHTEAQNFDAELQVVFEQNDIYGTCATQPHYAVLVFPVMGLRDYVGNTYLNHTLTTYNDFDLRKNLTNTILSDQVSYIYYQNSLHVGPCTPTNWYVMTQPIIMRAANLQALLARNTALGGPVQSEQIDFSKTKVLKGWFGYFGEDVPKDLNDTAEWAATWVAAIIPFVFLSFIGCIYGMWRISNVGRYKRPEKVVQDDEQMVIQDKENQDHEHVKLSG